MKYLNVSQYGIDLIKSFEGLSLKPYLCTNGYITIGYGHRLNTVTDAYTTISEDKANTLLLEDLQIAKKTILRNVKVDLMQYNFDALTSFIFNVGSGSFQRSTLR